MLLKKIIFSICIAAILLTPSIASATGPTKPPCRLLQEDEDLPYEVPEIEVIQELHAWVRGAYFYPESLNWDERLSIFAQDWANYLAAKDKWEHRDQVCRNQLGLGENIAWAWNPSETPSVETLVLQWVNEAEYYSPGEEIDPSTDSFWQYGHFTQMVWQDTVDIGCGVATAKSKTRYLVCNYYPAGNIPFETPFPW